MADTERTDEDAAAAVQKGDAAAFGILVERYEAKLTRYGLKFLSDREDIVDLVQDSFVACYKNIRSYDPAQRFSPWIYRVAHNTFVNGLRSRIRHPLEFFDFDALVAHPVYDDPAEKERDLADMRKMIDAGLGKISPKYREALILYYLEELSYQEVADVLRIPASTVGVRIKRGKEALRTAYEGMNIDIHYHE